MSIREARKERKEVRTVRREARQERRTERRGERPERRRRSPEVARQELLDAAERVFLEFAPDQVGLKEIAREAGVSHALITHYFGTYTGLVEATLERRLGGLRETMILRLGEAGVLQKPEELLAILFATFEDPLHLRLMKWMVSNERPNAMHALALQHHGVKIVARQIALALRPQATPEMIETVEHTLMTAVAAALGYAISKHALAGAAGKPASLALDNSIRLTLAGMVQSYLTEQLGELPPPPA